MTVKIHEYGIGTETVVVVPTADVRSERFNAFRRSLWATTDSPLRLVAVESSGQEFKFSQSVNEGLKVGQKYFPKFIVISNDDVEFTAGWLSSILSCFSIYPKVGYATPDIVEDSQKHNTTLMPSMKTLALMLKFYSFAPAFLVSFLIKTRHLLLRGKYGVPNENTSVIMEGVKGLAINCQPLCALSAEALQTIGYFDENYHNGMEDTDFTVRTYLSGYAVCLDLRTTISHHVSATGGKDWAGIVSGDSIVKGKFISNLKIFLSKYNRQEYRRFLEACAENTKIINK